MSYSFKIVKTIHHWNRILSNSYLFDTELAFYRPYKSDRLIKKVLR